MAQVESQHGFPDGEERRRESSTEPDMMPAHAFVRQDFEDHREEKRHHSERQPGVHHLTFL
jgi:hypothetical protein